METLKGRRDLNVWFETGDRPWVVSESTPSRLTDLLGAGSQRMLTFSPERPTSGSRRPFVIVAHSGAIEIGRGGALLGLVESCAGLEPIIGYLRDELCSV